MKFQYYSNPHFHIPEKQNLHFGQHGCYWILEYSHTMETCEWCHLLSWCQQGERSQRRSWTTAAPPAWWPSSSLVWRRQLKADSFFCGPPLFFCLFSLFFFSLLHHCLEPRFHKVASLLVLVLVPGGRADGPQVERVGVPLVHGTPAICPSSLLSISVSCEYDSKSLSFM